MSTILALDFLDSNNELHVLEISEDGSTEVQKVLASKNYTPAPPNVISMALKIDASKFTDEEVEEVRRSQPGMDPKAGGYMSIGGLERKPEAQGTHLDMIKTLIEDQSEAKDLYDMVMRDYKISLGQAN